MASCGMLEAIDLWEFNLTSATWAQHGPPLTTSSNLEREERRIWPLPRANFSLHAINDSTLLFFGGQVVSARDRAGTNGLDLLKDHTLWSYALDTRTWQHIAHQGPQVPVARHSYASALMRRSIFLLLSLSRSCFVIVAPQSRHSKRLAWWRSRAMSISVGMLWMSLSTKVSAV